MNHKRKKRKIKTANGYLPGDGPIGNSKKDQTKQEKISDVRLEDELAGASDAQSTRDN